MSNTVSFQKGSRVCGRWQQIPVTLLGKRVYCQHCGGGFVASDAALGSGRVVDDLIARADAVLQQAAQASDADEDEWRSDA